MKLPGQVTHSDHDTRLEAYEELSAGMSDEVANAILALAAGDQPAEIRADATIALGPLIEDGGRASSVSEETFSEITQKLRAIFDDETQPPIVRRRALESLVRDPQPWQPDVIRKLLASPDEDWRLTATFAMGRMTGFEKELLAIVNTANGVLLAEAVRSAGQIGLTAAATAIRDLAASNGTERDLRIEAIVALPYVDPDSFSLLDELSTAKDGELAAAAEEALDELRLMNASDDDV